MIVRLGYWDKIRDKFDQWEKDQLNAAITGDSICPRGVVVNEQVLPESINAKLRSAIEQERKIF